MICDLCGDEIFPEEIPSSYSWVPLGLKDGKPVVFNAHEECWEDLHPLRQRAIIDLSFRKPTQGRRK